MTLAAGTRLGAYEVLGALGAGGMGEVYRAGDTPLQRDASTRASRRDREIRVITNWFEELRRNVPLK